jgi:cytochrome c-type biogenesis protein
MEIGFVSLILLPLGFGLIGFVEPCVIGAHLIFLTRQAERSQKARAAALIAFVSARTLVMGTLGASVGLLGQLLIGLQTGFWLVFGLLYCTIGAAFVLNRSGWLKRGIILPSPAWKNARSAWLVGAAFGLNIPACAAPILFGLLGLTVSGGSAIAGFTTMAIFALGLSAPLVVMTLLPAFARFVERSAEWLRARRWLTGALFVVLGIWSVYFGLFVDPADWSGQ